MESLTPELVKEMLLKWLNTPCKDLRKTKCDVCCPLWNICEDLTDLVEVLEEEDADE